MDISATSSKFENAFTPSVSASTEELRIANNVEEDGFEKVTVPETLDSAPIILKSQHDFVDEPLSPRLPRSQPTSTVELDETVRRLSLDTPEDTDMTSPPNEPEVASSNQEHAVSPTHAKSDPLSAGTSDADKTPTPSSPEVPSSPRNIRNPKDDEGQTSQLEGDSLQTAQDDSTQVIQLARTGSNDTPVVGDYLKIMFVEHRVVPTILVSLCKMDLFPT